MMSCVRLPFGWRLAAAIALLLAVFMRGDGGRARGDELLRYRHVYVPEDRVSELAGGYLPMKRAEFQRRIERLQALHGRQGARIAQVFLEGQWDAGGWLAGQARVHIVHAQPGTRVPVTLEPCGLAIGKPQWAEEPPRDARIGVLPDGTSVVLADRSSQLVFPWWMRPIRTTGDEWVFNLAMPAAAEHLVWLRLPKSLIPIVDRGVVQRREGDDEVSGQELQSWQIETGGASQIQLRLVQEDSTRRTNLVLVRDECEYRLSPHGLSVLVDLQLDVLGTPVDRLTLEMAGDLQLQQVQLGDQPVRWETAPGQRDDQQRIELMLPEPLLGADRVLQLRALAPLPAGERRTLPRFRVRGGIWQAGKSTLHVEHPLSIVNLTTRESQLAKAGLFSNPAESEVLDVQHLGPNAAIEITVARAPARIQVVAGTTIDVQGQDLIATCHAELQCASGELFALDLPLSAGWELTAVEARWIGSDGEADKTPIYDWDVGLVGSDRRLRVRLIRPIRPGRGLLLTARGRRSWHDGSGALSAAQLRMLAFAQSHLRRGLICLKSSALSRLRLTGAPDARWCRAAELPMAQRRLIAADAGAAILDWTPTADRLALRLRPGAPRLQADILLQASVEREQLTQVYRITCRPDGAAVQRLRVYIRPAQEGDLTWSVEGESGSTITARKLGRDEYQPAEFGGEGQLWELVLQRPRDVPFVLVGVRTSPLGDRQQLGLASVPEAATQSGVVQLRSLDGQPLTVQCEGLEPVPTKRISSARYSVVRGAFRYEPLERCQLTVWRTGELAAAWAWSACTWTQPTPQHTTHITRYYLENTGLRHLTISLPAGARLHEVAVDGEAVPIGQVESDTSIDIPLPQDRRFILLMVACQDEQRLPGAAGRLRPVWPKLSVPVLDRQWKCVLPPGYAAAVPGDDRDERRGWWVARRLVGSLASDWLVSLDRAVYRGAPQLVPADRAARLSVWDAAESVSKQLERPIDPAEPGPNWRQVFHGCLAPLHGDRPDLAGDARVDAVALRRLSIDPDARVAADGKTGAVQSPADACRVAGVAAVVHPKGIVFTSAERVGQLGVATARVAGGPVFVAEQPIDMQKLAGFVSLEWWSAEGRAAWPWSGEPQWVGWQPQWRVIDVALDDGDSRVVVYCSELVDAVSDALLLAAAGLLWWLGSLGWRRACLLLGAAGVGALVLPEAVAPLATAVVQGGLVGVALASLRLDRLTRRPVEASRGSTITVAAATSVGLLFIALLAVATGQEAPASRTKAYRVVIPIDAERRPVGDLVYLPREFYDALLALEARSPGTGSWMITAAVYELVLGPGADQADSAAPRIVATYDVEVFQENAAVLLPLEQDQVHVVSEQSHLNGQSVQLNWQADGKGLLITAPQRGSHRLELTLRPVVREEESVRSIELSIPKFVRSQLKVTQVDAELAIDVPQAVGRVQTGAGGVAAELGPADRLIVRWSPQPLRPTVRATTVEQLLWLRVSPGAVAIDGKFRFALADNGPLEVTLLVDPRLSVRSSSADWELTQLETSRGAWQRIRALRMHSAGAGASDLAVSFVLSGHPGIGQLQLPRIELEGSPAATRWLALSVSDALQYEVIDLGGGRAADVDQFAQLWAGTIESAPQRAFQLPASSSWTMSARPVESELTGQCATRVVCGLAGAAVEYTCRVEIVRGHCQVHRLHVPPQLAIESVSVVEDDVEQPLRWAADDSGNLLVLLGDRISGDHQLTLRGRLPLPSRGRWQLVPIRCLSVRVASHQLELWRQPQLQIEVVGHEGFRESPVEAASALGMANGRLVGAFQLQEDAQSNLILRIAPNRSRVKCSQWIAVRRQGENWQVESQLELTPEGGSLEVVFLEIPADLLPPLEVQPAAVIERLPSPEEGRDRLWIWLDEPRSQPFRLTLKAAFNGQPFRAPNIQPLGATLEKRLLVLPNRLRDQQIEWRVAGLSPVDADQGQPPIANNEDVSVYRIDRPTFSAMIQGFRSDEQRPTVRLAEATCVCRRDGNVFGSALFLLDPASRSDVTLDVPSNYELVHVAVDGQPALAGPAGGNRWRVQLSSRRLPQRIGVVFRGRLPGEQAAGPAVKLRLPTVADAAMPSWIIQIYDPRTMRLRADPSQATTLTARQVARLRLQSYADAIEWARERLAERPRAEITHWYARWGLWLAGARRRCTLSEAADDRQRVQQVMARQAELAQQLGVAKPWESAADSSSPPDLLDEWAEMFLPGGPAVIVQAASVPDEGLTIQMRALPAWRWMVPAAAAICALGLVCIVLAAWLDLWAQWPQVLGVVGGWLWWLWLSPSVFGLVILAACLLVGLVPGGRVHKATATRLA